METIIAYEYTTRTHLLVTDEDAADFLQSQFTNELRPFAMGACTYGLWLDVKGKVIGDSVVLCQGDEQFRVFSECSEGAQIAAKLQQHIIADDVVIESQPACQGFALIGDGAAELLQQLGYEQPAEGAYREQRGVCLYHGRRSLRPSYELICLDPAATDLLSQQLTEAGVEWPAAEQIQIERLGGKYPLVPIEIGPQDLPGEGELEMDAISFTKGCYLGQEVVARMYNVGRPQRALFLLEGVAPLAELPRALYNADQKKVGELRTAYFDGDSWLGVALLKTRFAQSGDCLRHDQGSAKVVDVFSSQQKVAE
jgi:tRNA-modifying protein YgfZ